MTTFDEREQGFEAHFALEEEIEFKAHVRRDKLIGLWAGELMGLKDGALKDYAASLVRTEIRTHDDERLFQKIVADLADSGVDIMPREVRARMEQLLAQARTELKDAQ